MIQERMQKIQEHLGEKEALLVTSVPNRYYFTGFESSAGSVVIFRDAAYFLIDFRYFEKAKSVVDSCEVRLSERSVSEIGQLLARHGARKLFVEARSTSVATLRAYREALVGVEISEEDTMDALIESMRAVKTEEEVQRIEAAQALTDDTFSYILERIAPGRTERDVMLDMEFYMRKLGSEGVSFDFIVVSGKNSSLPHGVPTDKKIEKGDFLTMDFGAIVDGYHSDMTRTVAVGAASEDMKKVYNTVLEAQLAAIEAVRPGVVCKDIDTIARNLIYRAGYEGCFGHGLGHSVGLEIHENPNFNTRCETILPQGAIMTVEPGIYLENRFGVRIEDMVYVTEDGCRDLTRSAKNLIVL